MLQVTLLGEICVTNDSIFMFTYPYSNREMVLYSLYLKPGLFLYLFILCFFSTSLRGCHFFGIVIQRILLLFLNHFFSFTQLQCLCAYIRRLNALQWSQVGQLLPSPQALCLCALSALFCCQTRRLVIQSG